MKNPKKELETAITSLTSVVQLLEYESNCYVDDGYSDLIHNGDEHLQYHQLYESCKKTLTKLQLLVSKNY